MPLYEYECQRCGHRFEMLQKVADSPLKVCVKCEGEVERLLSSPAIQFKGSGWYITDYARKSEAPSTQSSDKNSDKTDKSKESSGSTSKAAKSEDNRSKSGPAASASSTSKD